MVTPMSGRGLHTKTLIRRIVPAVLFLFIATALSVPFLVNSEYVKNRIAKTVRSQTGINVTLSDISISFSPGFHIAFSNIRTRTDERGSGSIDSLLVYPDVVSLVKGRIIITKVVLEDFEAGKPFEKLLSGKVPFPKAVSPLLIRDAMDRFAPFIHGDNGIEIELENPDTPFFTVKEISARMRRVNKGITGTIRLEDLEMKGESFQSLFPARRTIPSADTDTMDIRFSADENGRLSGECEFRNLVLHSAKENDLSLNPEEPTVTFDISPLKSALRFQAASLAPVLQNPEISFVRMEDVPSTTLKFGAERVNIDTARSYANAFIRDNIVTRHIFRIIESGVSPRIEVAFENRKLSGLFHPKNLTIKGTLRSGKVNIPQSGLTARNVSGGASMKDGTLDLEVGKGKILNSEIQQGTVSVELLSGPNIPFTSQFNLTADLRQAPATLSRLIHKEKVANELNRLTVEKGSALVDLFLAKNRKNDLTVEVKAEDIRLEGRYDRMDDRIEIFDGSLVYKNKTARIDHLTAGSGENYLYDTCMDVRISPEPVANIRSGKALFQVSEIFPYLVSTEVFPAESIPFSPESGTVWIDSMNLALPFKAKGKQTARITGKAKDIKAASAPGKEEACVLSFDFSASGSRMLISGLTGRVEDLQSIFELSDSPFVKGIRPPFEIASGRMEITPGELFFTGTLDFSTGPTVEVTGRKRAPVGFSLEHLSISDQPATRFDFRNTDEKATLKGFMSSSTLEKLFTHRFLAEIDFFQMTKENHFLISSDQEGFLKLEAYRINLAPVLDQKKERAELPEWLTDKSIRVKTRHLDAGRYGLDKVTALLDIKPDKAVVRLKKAELCGIDITGTLIKKGDFLEYRANAEVVESDDLGQTVECLFVSDALMDGSFSFEGRFQSKSAMEQIKETVTGRFDLFASNGRIYRLTLLSRILSVINVSKFLQGSLPDILQDGFAFNTFSLKADVKESRIIIKEGIIDGTDMSILFTGDVDPVQKQIDLTFLVAPFKTVDMIIQKIPVLNTLLGGKLVSIPVKAEGSMKNPVVVPLHPSAVGQGLTHMMKNMVDAPVKLLEKLP